MDDSDRRTASGNPFADPPAQRAATNPSHGEGPSSSGQGSDEGSGEGSGKLTGFIQTFPEPAAAPEVTTGYPVVYR